MEFLCYDVFLCTQGPTKIKLSCIVFQKNTFQTESLGHQTRACFMTWPFYLVEPLFNPPNPAIASSLASADVWTPIAPSVPGSSALACLCSVGWEAALRRRQGRGDR